MTPALTAVRPAAEATEPLTVTASPDMVGRSDCDSCPHGRNQHSINGCTWTESNGSGRCSCTRTYMDL